MTPDQARQLEALHDLLVPHAGWDYKVTDDPRNAISYLRNIHALGRRIDARVAGLDAAIEKLAQLVGSDVDTAQVVAAVERAIADAVVQVDIDITGAGSS